MPLPSAGRMTAFHPHIERAVARHGSQAKLAAAIGCSQQQIAYLLKARTISAEMALRVEAATGGAVNRHDLRPDLFGPRPAPTEDAA